MKTNHKMHGGFTLVELLVVIVIIAALAALTAPQVIKMKKKGDLADSTNNARQLGLGLAQFDADVGGYPDDSTVDTVKAIAGDDTGVSLEGSTSNDYFRQLIVAGVVDSEQPFFARTTYIKGKPDDLMNDDEMLKGGEVGFGYIMQEAGKSVSITAGKPVAAAPLKETGGSDGAFENDPYDGKAIVLFTDSSVRALGIRKSDSKAMLLSKKSILEGGADTVWDVGATPVMMAPEPKK